MAYIETVANPELVCKLEKSAAYWTDAGEVSLFKSIDSLNRVTLDSVSAITGLVVSAESFFNDAIADRASDIYNHVVTLLQQNDKLLAQLIAAKNTHLEKQQNSIVQLQFILYIAIFSALVLVASISIFGWRYSRKHVVSPLLRLQQTIQDMAYGIVEDVQHTKRSDEIGKIQNAISEMAKSVRTKISFAEKLGKGSYDAGFSLLSNRDELGLALLKMRDELKGANETLKANSRRLIEAQRMAKVGHYQVDIKTGMIQSSEMLDEILGVHHEVEKTFSSWLRIIEPEFLPEFEAVSKKAQEDHTLANLCFKVRRFSDGEVRWVEMIGDRNYDENGNPEVLFGTIQDINQSKLLEMELNESYKIATEQNKRLLNFSYIVSHNLRMHAVNIHSLLTMIRETENPDEVAEFMTMLNTASEMLNETMLHLNDVVAVQNAVNVEVKPLILNRHIDHALSVLSTQISQKGAQIINRVADEVEINYNPAYLDSVVLNFISNAIKYSHPERKPVVEINCHPVHPPHGHAKWVLTISDNGIGIDLARHGGKLFGMYKTFHTNKDAKGIGLFLTKYQVESMGGSIEVESEPGKGTSFRIYFR